MKRTVCMWVGAGVFNLLWLAGCGGDAPSSSRAATTAGSAAVAGRSGSDAANAPAPLPAATARPVPPVDARAKLPEEGSPEWLVLEMARLRVAPLVSDEPPHAGEPIQPVAASVDVERLRTAARERNLRIIDLAEEAIAQTHRDAQKERLFNAAVHHLTEARLQLALHGEQAHIDALYENAEVLKRRDPQSKAAAEAALALVKYAETNARKFAARELEWLEHFARQARLFAGDFPQQATRAISMLDAAAWSCEAHGLRDEALACYTQIQQQYPQHAQAQHVAAILRRFHLKGQPLQMQGTTFDGGELRVEDLRGKIVLLVFWAAGRNGFDAHLPALHSALERYAGEGLVVVGVNLDTDEQAVEAFLDEHEITWPNIFFVEPARRGWENPIVRYYGIRSVPAYWLVDREGKVLDTDVDPAQLDSLLGPLFASTGSNRPAGE